jgi:hypothetical protein
MFVMMPAAAEHTLLTVRFDKQHWKNDVAETARKPYGYKQNNEYSNYQRCRHRLIGVHHNMRRRCPGAYQNVKGVRQLRPRQKIRNQYPQ